MIPYPPSVYPLPGCSACDRPHSHEQERCSVNGCTKEFCASCSWHCAECDRVICTAHSETVNGDQFCIQHAAEMREHYGQLFWSIRADYEERIPCDCGGPLEDMTDPFTDRTIEEDYGCLSCGLLVSKRLHMTQDELRWLRAEGLMAVWPPPEYLHTEGRRQPAAQPKRSIRKVA